MLIIMSILNFKWFSFTFCFLWNAKSYLPSSWLCFQSCVCLAIGKTDAEAEAPILWPSDVKNWLTGKDWCRERLKTGGERDDRVWDGWMTSLTWWTWVWASLGSCWWIGKPGLLQYIELQRVGQDWATELNWTDSFCLCWAIFPFPFLFWAPKFPFHLVFETLNLLIALCFKSERGQSCNLQE